MRGEFWTNERIELVKRLWADGKTANAIAACLGGISRSAVLGKIFRLRLCPPDGAPASPQHSDLAPADRNGQSHKRRASRAVSSTPFNLFAHDETLARRRRGGMRDKLRNPPAAAAKRRGKTLLELTNTSCRWPHGHPGTAKFHFCGAPDADLERGIPYCARHTQRAYSTGRDSTKNANCAPAANGVPRPQLPSVLLSGLGQRPFVFNSGQRRSRL